MSKEWKRVIAILVFIAGGVILLVALGLIELRDSVDEYDASRRAIRREDRAAAERDSLQHAKNDSLMRAYLQQHPAAVRDKY